MIENKRELKTMLIDIAKQQLMKAGWYEGRKIDISDFIKKSEEQGYYVFPAAKKFFEEFGGLNIVDKIVDDEGNININESFVLLNTQRINIFGNGKIEKILKQNTIHVLDLDHGEIPIYIAEDGKFYTLWYGGGLWAENSDQLWNEYYGDEFGRSSWEDLKAGKGRTMHKCEIQKYL